MRKTQYAQLALPLDDAELERMAVSLGDLFFDAMEADIEQSKVRLPMRLEPDQASIAELTAGLLEHSLRADAMGAYLIPTPLVLLGERLTALRRELWPASKVAA